MTDLAQQLRDDLLRINLGLSPKGMAMNYGSGYSEEQTHADERYGEELSNAQQQWAHELDLERQKAALDALLDCKRRGALPSMLVVLAAEIGLLSQWREVSALCEKENGNG
jgi:hypothetical protein